MLIVKLSTNHIWISAEKSGLYLTYKSFVVKEFLEKIMAMPSRHMGALVLALYRGQNLARTASWSKVCLQFLISMYIHLYMWICLNTTPGLRNLERSSLGWITEMLFLRKDRTGDTSLIENSVWMNHTKVIH